MSFDFNYVYMMQCLRFLKHFLNILQSLVNDLKETYDDEFDEMRVYTIMLYCSYFFAV